MFAWRGIPFRAVDVMGRGVMALVAVAGIDRFGNEIGIAERVGMLAARPVAVLALDVAEGGEVRVARPAGTQSW